MPLNNEEVDDEAPADDAAPEEEAPAPEEEEKETPEPKVEDKPEPEVEDKPTPKPKPKTGGPRLRNAGAVVSEDRQTINAEWDDYGQPAPAGTI